MTVQA